MFILFSIQEILLIINWIKNNVNNDDEKHGVEWASNFNHYICSESKLAIVALFADRRLNGGAVVVEAWAVHIVYKTMVRLLFRGEENSRTQ